MYIGSARRSPSRAVSTGKFTSSPLQKFPVQNYHILLLNDPGRARSQKISIVRLTQWFDFDCNLVVARKVIIPSIRMSRQGTCKIHRQKSTTQYFSIQNTKNAYAPPPISRNGAGSTKFSTKFSSMYSFIARNKVPHTKVQYLGTCRDIESYTVEIRSSTLEFHNGIKFRSIHLPDKSGRIV